MDTHTKRGSSAAIAGSLSGALALIFVQPLDVIKTRQQQKILDKDNAQKYKGILRAVKTIVSEEGVRALWKGTSPGLFRVIPGAGLNFLALHTITNLVQTANGSNKLTSFQSLFVGASSRIIATIVVVPLTVVKTRFEGHGTHLYNGTIHALKTVYHTEGIKGLWSGMNASLLRDVPFSGIYFFLYSRLKEEFKSSHFVESSTIKNFSAGFIAGSLATLITHPADVIRTRLQIIPVNCQNREIVYKGSIDVIKRVMKEEGFLGLFKGSIPRLVRRPISNAITWAAFEEIVKLIDGISKNLFKF